MDGLPVVLVVALGLGFAYTNGFHDAANAIATSVSSRVLTPGIAVGMASTANFLGAFFGEKVARTIGTDLIGTPTGTTALSVVAAALLAAVMWNVVTWWFGMPSSSTHALVGGLCGASVVAGLSVNWDGVLGKVVVPMVVSPLAGALAGYLSMTALLWAFRRSRRQVAARGFRYAQTASGAAMAFGHGMQDAAKSAGAITLALTAAGRYTGDDIPLWALVAAALAMSLGTYAGGWRIMRTVGQRIIRVDPPHGLAAETSASLVLYVAGLGAGVPISTTHTIAGSVLGVGATARLGAIRWAVVRDIALTWVLTWPAAALIAATLELVLRLV